MAFYPENYWLYATMAGSTVDITPYAIKEDIKCEWGIEGNEAIDLLADTGSMEFVLNNKANLFTPGHANVLEGWQKGIVIELVIRFNHDDFKRFRGTLEDLKYDDTNYTVRCVCLDWLDESAKYPLTLLTSGNAQKGNQALDTIIAGMPISPLATDFDTGNSTFDVVFNDTNPNTKAYTEMKKIANSEYSRIYLQKDKANGEKLVFENRNHRTGLTEIDSIEEETDFINSTDGYTTNTTGGKIVYRLVDFDAEYDNTMTHITTEYGKGVINNMIATAYPKTIDANARVLFSLPSPIPIDTVRSVTLYGQYTDTNGLKCNGIEMVTPAPTTDFLINTHSDGGGVNLTESGSCIAVLGTSQTKFMVTNGGNYTGYITKLEVRGKGISNYTPITYIEENSISWDKYGYQNASLNQAYQTDLDIGTGITRTIVENEKDPKTKIIDVSFNANTSNFLMTSFLYLDVGSLIHLKSDRYGLDGYFYIQKVKFTIGIGGVIMFTWKLVLMCCLLSGCLSPVISSFDSSGSGGIDFGYLSQVSNLTERTFSADIYITDSPVGTPNTIVSIMSYLASTILYINADRKIVFMQKGDDQAGVWITPGAVIEEDNWYTVTSTRDSSDPSNSPIVYINGSSVSLDEFTEMKGDPVDETDAHVFIGNVKTAARDWDWGFENGYIKNVKIYNRIVTSTEAEDLTNVTNGLVFHGLNVKTSELDYFDNKVLDKDNDRLIDDIYSTIGLIHEPITTQLIPYP